MQWKVTLGLIQTKDLMNVQSATKNLHKVVLETGIFTACIKIPFLTMMGPELNLFKKNLYLEKMAK